MGKLLRRVSVGERLPAQTGWYTTETAGRFKETFFDVETSRWGWIEFWLEELTVSETSGSDRTLAEAMEAEAWSLGYDDWSELEKEYVDKRKHFRELTRRVAERYLSSQRLGVENLERWKGEATKVLNDLELQTLGTELGIPLGEEIAKQVLPKVLALKGRIAELTEALEHVKGYLGSDQREQIEKILKGDEKDI